MTVATPGLMTLANDRRRLKRELTEAVADGCEVALGWDRQAAIESVEDPNANAAEWSRRLDLFLKGLAGELFAGAGMSCLVLVGGDTAFSMLTGLGASGIALHSELQPGMPMGRIVGGAAEGTDVVTKAGGFGSKDALVRVVEHLRALRRTS